MDKNFIIPQILRLYIEDRDRDCILIHHEIHSQIDDLFDPEFTRGDYGKALCRKRSVGYSMGNHKGMWKKDVITTDGEKIKAGTKIIEVHGWWKLIVTGFDQNPYIMVRTWKFDPYDSPDESISDVTKDRIVIIEWKDILTSYFPHFM